MQLIAVHVSKKVYSKKAAHHDKERLTHSESNRQRPKKKKNNNHIAKLEWESPLTKINKFRNTNGWSMLQLFPCEIQSLLTRKEYKVVFLSQFHPFSEFFNRFRGKNKNVNKSAIWRTKKSRFNCLKMPVLNEKKRE